MFCWNSVILVLLAASCSSRSRNALHFMQLFSSSKNPSANGATERVVDSQDTPAERILGGTPADDGAFPFMAKLFIENSQVFCGGTLISPNYLMTAAHCARNIQDINATLVGLGTNRLDNIGGLWVGIESVTIHDGFSINTGNDIAILKLRRPVDYPPLIQPIHLYGEDATFPFLKATAAGWGWYTLLNGTGGEHPEKSLWCLYTEVRVPDVKWCNATWYDYDHVNVWDNEICAGDNGRGTWVGDSGGPLMAQDPSTGDWYQDGITSFGATYYYNQQGQLPAVYTRVSYFCDYIKTTTSGEAVCGSVLPATPRPPSNCPVGWRPSAAVTNKCYYTFESISENFTKALTICSLLATHGTLVSIQNGFENSAVADQFRAGGQYWIGLNATTDGIWGWLDGQNLTYTNWANGEPSQSTGCVVVDPSSMKWRVAACGNVNLAVCELSIEQLQ